MEKGTGAGVCSCPCGSEMFVLDTWPASALEGSLDVSPGVHFLAGGQACGRVWWDSGVSFMFVVFWFPGLSLPKHDLPLWGLSGHSNEETWKKAQVRDGSCHSLAGFPCALSARERKPFYEVKHGSEKCPPCGCVCRKWSSVAHYGRRPLDSATLQAGVGLLKNTSPLRAAP